MTGEICTSKSRSLFPQSVFVEDVRQRAPLHCSTCLGVCSGGLEWHPNQNAAEGWVTGVVLYVWGCQLHTRCLSPLIARHMQQRPLAPEMKKYISNSSSVLLLKHLRHVWLWLQQERSNLCCWVLGHEAKAAGNEPQPANVFAAITFVFKSHVALIICP